MHFSGAEKCVLILLRRRKAVFKYFPDFSGAGEVYLDNSPAPEKYFLYDTSPAPEEPGKYLKTPFRRRRSIYTHFSGAGEVLIYNYLAPERPEKPEKPEKYLYTPLRGCLHPADAFCHVCGQL